MKLMRFRQWLNEGSTGVKNWEKNFSNKESFTTTVKTKSYIYDKNNERSGVIEVGEVVTIPDNVPFDETTKRIPIQYKNEIVYIHIDSLNKNTKASKVSKMDARVFSSKGKNIEFEFENKKISSVMFDSAEQIKVSILEGIRQTDILSSDIFDKIKLLFDSKKIEWGDTEKEIINKLGNYIGELLVGYYLLDNDKQAFTSYPFNENIQKFVLPTDPSFSGYDSFTVTDKGNIIPLSSKYGAGAKASIFSNLLPKGIEHLDELAPSKFKDLLSVVATNNLNPKQSKDVVYFYGIRNILGIKQNQIKDPRQVYVQIVKKSLGNEANIAIEKARQLKIDSKFIDKLPYTMSAIFNKIIASHLNEDKSIEQMKQILAAKDFYQANLDIKSWQNGTVKFNLLRSGSANLKIIGTKAADITDMSASQGWVNYELSYSK